MNELCWRKWNVRLRIELELFHHRDTEDTEAELLKRATSWDSYLCELCVSVVNLSLNHSRSAVTGSIRVARNAGSRQASKAATPSTNIATSNETGSVADTP